MEAFRKHVGHMRVGKHGQPLYSSQGVPMIRATIRERVGEGMGGQYGTLASKCVRTTRRCLSPFTEVCLCQRYFGGHALVTLPF